MSNSPSHHLPKAARTAYYVVVCSRTYQAPIGGSQAAIFKKGEVYQAERQGNEYRVWRSKRSFLKFSPPRFVQYFEIFC